MCSVSVSDSVDLNTLPGFVNTAGLGSMYLFVLSQYLPSYLSLTLNVLSSMTPFLSLLCIETVSFSQMLVCRLKTRGNC